MTPAYPELVAAVRREGEALVAAAGLGLDAPVPSCPPWTVERLVRHVGRVFHGAAGLVSQRVAAAPEGGWAPRPPEGVDPVAYAAEGLEEVVEALSGAEPDTPVWNWSVAPDTAQFWARRMAHEAAVHRWDTQQAHDVAQPIGADIAGDGIDELAGVLMPRIFERGVTGGPVGTLAVTASDDGAWRFSLTEAGLTVLAPSGPADATVSGPACDLLLVLYGRLPVSAVSVDGDPGLLDAWVTALRP